MMEKPEMELIRANIQAFQEGREGWYEMFSETPGELILRLLGELETVNRRPLSTGLILELQQLKAAKDVLSRQMQTACNDYDIWLVLCGQFVEARHVLIEKTAFLLNVDLRS